MKMLWLLDKQINCKDFLLCPPELAFKKHFACAQLPSAQAFESMRELIRDAGEDSYISWQVLQTPVCRESWKSLHNMGPQAQVGILLSGCGHGKSFFVCSFRPRLSFNPGSRFLTLETSNGNQCVSK